LDPEHILEIIREKSCLLKQANTEIYMQANAARVAEQ